VKKIKILVIFLLLAVNFLLLPSKGTGDVINWQTLTGKIISSKPDKMIREAVLGMLPKNKLRKHLVRRLKIYLADQHPHAAQTPERLEVI